MYHYPILFFFFNDTATTEIYTLSLHDALPISGGPPRTSDSSSEAGVSPSEPEVSAGCSFTSSSGASSVSARAVRAVSDPEEHTSELQSRQYLVCRLLLEKKKSPYFYLYSRTIF